MNLLNPKFYYTMETLLSYAPHFIQALGWCLLHSLWQGALVYALLIGLFRFIPTAGAKLRYGCSLIALLLLCLWIGATGIAQWQRLQTLVVYVSSGSGSSYRVSLPESAPIGAITFSKPALAGMMPWLVLGYITGLILMMIRLAGGFSKLGRLSRAGVMEADAQTIALLNSLLLQLGIASSVALRLSTQIAVPIVIGALRPLILLPASMVESLGPEGLKAILMHELAHIDRKDYLINVLQIIAETLLFFNPFVWMLCGLIRREREHCCDDLVLEYTGQPLLYAQSLAVIAGVRSPVAALSANGNTSRTYLLNRIKRIIEMKKAPTSYTRLIVVSVLALVLITGSVIWLTPSFAQQKKRDVQVPKSNNSSTHNSMHYTITDSNGTQTFENVEDMPPAEAAKLKQELHKLEKSLAPLQQLGQVNIPDVPMPPMPPEPPAPPAMRDDSDVAAQAAQITRFATRTAAASAPVVRAATATAVQAARTAAAAIASVDWSAINKEMAEAAKEVEAINWADIDRQVAISISAAQREMERAPNSRKIRREVVTAMRDAANERRQAMEEQRRDAEAARRDMEETRRDLEQARKELDQIRAELEQERHTNQTK